MGASLFGEELKEREATIDVARGLFLIKYASGSASGRSPRAIVRPARGSEPFIEVISAPGVVVGYLGAPGACAVIRAERAGRLALRIRADDNEGSLDASFRVESVGAEQAVVAGSSVAASPRGEAGSDGLRVLAHVSRRGDIEVGAGAWVAGPDAPAAIEGLELRGAIPGGVNIEVQPLVATNPVRWLDWSSHGAFVGTRGRALPLAGLRLRLAGEQAANYVLAADALFLGSAVVSKKGREIEFLGSAAGDPLVGLRLDLVPEARLASEAALSEQRREPRVRVFRASAGA